MALQEVKRFMQYLSENRKALADYNKKLQESSCFIFTEPTFVSTGYYVSPMIPESIEDELLLEIIELDERSARKLERLRSEKGEEYNLKDCLVRKFNTMTTGKKTQKERILTHEENKRHRLFQKLAAWAQEDGFDISPDDLLYFIGKAVLAVIAEHPDYDENQIFESIVNDFF
ncbi:hypothetical protein [Acetobacterium sp.]|uniref:hypothetical protein n=1 Tax=Acetobacterium sp. TaxID=1872094 RepID=UPI0035938B1C